jgi:asparagine synthase (glutamine-hydrolysing)
MHPSLVLAGAEHTATAGVVTCWFSGELHGMSQSPAQAVASVVSEQGLTALEELRGAYVLAVWDSASEVLAVTQDHLCARAVFVLDTGEAVFFASELRPLLDAVPTRPAASAAAVSRWITDRALPDGLTLYDGVRRLGIGEMLVIDSRTARRTRIWRPTYSAPATLSREDAAALLRDGIERAILRRAPLDASTGMLLSGGFDSGTIASFLAPALRERGLRLPAYSSVFPGEPWDESPWVAILTEDLRLEGTQVRTRGGALHLALQYEQRWHLPQPAPGSMLDQPLLDLARGDGRTVVLDGQGGDELFMASPYLLADLLARGRWSRAARLVHRYPGTANGLRAWQAKALLRQVVAKGLLPYHLHRHLHARRREEYAQQHWLRPATREQAEALDDPLRWKRGARGRPRWWSFLAYHLTDARLLAGMQDYLRRRGELAGVRSAQPLMTDVDLVETALAVPPDMAFSPQYDRALARDAMLGIVPEAVRLPIRKSNYAGLMHQTLAVEDVQALRRVLEQPDAEVGAYVDLSRMRDGLLGRIPSFQQRAWDLWGQRIWGLATTEMWLRREALGDAFGCWASELNLTPPSIEVVRRP